MAMNKGYLRVISSGHYVPDTIISNQDLEQVVDTSDQWIISRTGIKERHLAFCETTSDLAYKAAKNAIDKANYDVN
ncbi:MAG: 3-oxoacyl-ACP synthase, partial [Bacilli bacterium]|nr:3-oxoacyl-ACP synthase [Bacilli bacterium]